MSPSCGLSEIGTKKIGSACHELPFQRLVLSRTPIFNDEKSFLRARNVDSQYRRRPHAPTDGAHAIRDGDHDFYCLRTQHH
jgi:hypothetical protein